MDPSYSYPVERMEQDVIGEEQEGHKGRENCKARPIQHGRAVEGLDDPLEEHFGNCTVVSLSADGAINKWLAR